MITPAKVYRSITGMEQTTRQERIFNRVVAPVAALAIAAAGGGVLELTANANEAAIRPSSEQVAENAKVLAAAKSPDDFMGTFILKPGVNVRLSEQYNNGDNSLGTRSNIALTLSKALTVKGAVVDNDGWVAFERPDAQLNADATQEEMAENLVYTNVSSLEKLSPTQIEVEGTAFSNNYVDSNGEVASVDITQQGAIAPLIESYYPKPIIE